jgi:hypothetical protein
MGIVENLFNPYVPKSKKKAPGFWILQQEKTVHLNCIIEQGRQGKIGKRGINFAMR